ncbi:alpha/beta hydrolase family protein [Pedobacter deserti]|uniref:alpha/beta hydrolase family protein n=1 Tax=Pedobacter deserti TaxID=2817382 RepID=UPI00210B1115|nr:prolyl oligopeptidase family serine peptidase [Pedobacter sp. SYSU D00382]
MKISPFILLCLVLVVTSAFGQKKIVDVAACNKWEQLEELNGKSGLLSANGNYILFKEKSETQGATTILKNIQSGSERKFQSTGNDLLFNNDKMFAFQFGKDSLAIFDTERGVYHYINAVNRCFVIPSSNGNRLAYLTETSGKKSLTICDLDGKQIKEISYVDDYWLHKGGKGMLIKGKNGLIYLDLSTYHHTVLSKDANIDAADFSESGNEIAYILNTETGRELRCANIYTGENITLLDESSDFLKSRWELEPYRISFDNGHGNVFFKIAKRVINLDDQSESVITKDVNVWSNRDFYVQQNQLANLKKHNAYTAMINVRTGKTIQLESDSMNIVSVREQSEYLLLTNVVNENEFYWNTEKMSLYLFSTTTGERKLVKKAGFPGFAVIGISPDDKFLVWFDGQDGNYYSYNFENQKIINISRFKDNSLRLIDQRAESAGYISHGYPQNGQYWVANNASLIVHSKNDIWQLDPLGVRKPINLTNAYGHRHDIRFKIIDQENAPFQINDKEYLVSAFNNRSKQNGFWKISVGKSVEPVKLVMSDDAYFFAPLAPIITANAAENPECFKPIKAFKKNLFVLRKMNSANPANLYSTLDFKNFKQLSGIKASDEYVKVYSKLITYTLPDGRQVEGILHLPDDLDMKKKYPVIFNYYERRSELLNVNRTPQLSGHNINIPWYVSRGYLVFEPDFYYKRGETSKSVINCAEAAIFELAKLPYVDTSRMGAQGQSFGGYESNVLAIQTKFFKAVCAMAGPSNIISEYGSIRPSGFSNQSSSDRGQRNLGVFPWEQPEVFIENSPVFHIDKSNTPLLLVHNKRDGAILFSQAMELFLGLRRINKKIWMLEYDGEGHTIEKDENKLDFTIRMQQFFDHYLKGAPAPRWMTRGIPAAMKGIDSGLEYDTEIKTPGEGIARPVPPEKIF